MGGWLQPEPRYLRGYLARVTRSNDSSHFQASVSFSKTSVVTPTCPSPRPSWLAWHRLCTASTGNPVGINVIDIQTRLTMTVRIEPATEESKKLVEQLRREKKEREDWERQQEQGRLLLGGSFVGVATVQKSLTR